MTKVALYARVSTDDKGQTVENQLDAMRNYCKNMEWEYQEFSDEESGRTMDRPHYNEMISALSDFDGVVVWHADRFARNVSEGLREVDNILSLGIFFEISDGGIQIHQYPMPSSVRLILTMLFAFAEFESYQHGERVKAGMNRMMEEIQQKGYYISRKTGNRVSRIGRPGAAENLDIHDIMRMRDEGYSLQEIADKMGSKKSTILYRIQKYTEKGPKRD